MCGAFPDVLTIPQSSYNLLLGHLAPRNNARKTLTSVRARGLILLDAFKLCLAMGKPFCPIEIPMSTSIPNSSTIECFAMLTAEEAQLAGRRQLPVQR